MPLICPSDAPAHGLAWHYAPVVLAGALGATAGRLAGFPDLARAVPASGVSARSPRTRRAR
jgi:hypothetical protein